MQTDARHTRMPRERGALTRDDLDRCRAVTSISPGRWANANVRLVEEQGLGLGVRDWREAPAAVARLAADRELRDAVTRRLAALPANRAVYEALEVIDGELSARQPRKTA